MMHKTEATDPPQKNYKHIYLRFRIKAIKPALVPLAILPRAKYLLYCASEGGMRQTEILFTRNRNNKKLFEVDGALPEILYGNSMDNHHEWVTVTPKVSVYKDDGDAVHNINQFWGSFRGANTTMVKHPRPTISFRTSCTAHASGG